VLGIKHSEHDARILGPLVVHDIQLNAVLEMTALR